METPCKRYVWYFLKSLYYVQNSPGYVLKIILFYSLMWTEIHIGWPARYLPHTLFKYVSHQEALRSKLSQHWQTLAETKDMWTTRSLLNMSKLPCSYTHIPARFPRVEGESGNVSEHHTSRSNWLISRTACDMYLAMSDGETVQKKI